MADDLGEAQGQRILRGELAGWQRLLQDQSWQGWERVFGCSCPWPLLPHCPGAPEEEGDGAGLVQWVDRGKFLPILLLIKCLSSMCCTTFPERPQTAMLGWQGQMKLGPLARLPPGAADGGRPRVAGVMAEGIWDSPKSQQKHSIHLSPIGRDEAANDS